MDSLLLYRSISFPPLLFTPWFTTVIFMTLCPPLWRARAALWACIFPNDPQWIPDGSLWAPKFVFMKEKYTVELETINSKMPIDRWLLASSLYCSTPVAWHTGRVLFSLLMRLRRANAHRSTAVARTATARTLALEDDPGSVNTKIEQSPSLSCFCFDLKVKKKRKVAVLRSVNTNYFSDMLRISGCWGFRPL